MRQFDVIPHELYSPRYKHHAERAARWHVACALSKRQRVCPIFVSKCDSDDFAGQIHDAIAFLSVNEADIVLLMRSAGATGVLDFAVEVQPNGFQFLAFPPALVAQAGSMGRALEKSLYSSVVS